MSIVKHAGDTVGSILGAISTTANAASRTVTTAATTLDMLDAYIQRAKAQQTIDISNEMATYERGAILKAAEAHQKLEEDILRRVHSDPIRKKHFDEIHALLVAKLHPAVEA